MSNKKGKFLYVVPRQKFFSEGYRGRVMHAIGIAEGLHDNGCEIHLVGGKGLSRFCADVPSGVKLIEVEESQGNVFSYFSWYFKLTRQVLYLKKLESYDSFIIRYAISSFPFIFLTSLLFKRVKTVIEVNFFAYQYYFKSGTLLNNLIAKIEVWLCNKFDTVYVVSDTMMNDQRSLDLMNKSISIPNGATSKRLNFKGKEEFNGPQRLVYLGSLMDYWDYSVVLNAVKNSKGNYELHVYGTGPMENRIRQEVKNLSNVFFHGRFNRNELGESLNRDSDVLILPPKTAKDMKSSGGLSTKAFDYLTMELPIIVPSDGELLRVYKDNINCLTYTRNDWSEINTAMERISKDKELRLKLARNAYQTFIENYSWKARMSKLIDKVWKI